MSVKKKEEEAPRSYYEVIYKNRAGYTGHYIPVRIMLHISGSSGIYLEAYLVSPPIPSEDSKKKIEVKILCLPTNMKNEIFILQNRIYPTGRSMKKLDPETMELVPAVLGSDLKHFYPKPIRFSNSVIDKLEEVSPGGEWTMQELQAVMGRGPNDPHKPADLSDKLYSSGNKRRCTITNEVEGTYVLEDPANQVHALDESRPLPEIEKEYESCSLCALGDLRRSRRANLVFGLGPENAVGMIIAESPWEMEEKDKRPLHPQAPAGKVLSQVMRRVHLKQSEWYLTNSIICRPLRAPGGDLSKNKPTRKDVKACNSRLKETIRTVSPKIVVLLGKHAYLAWFGKEPENVLKSQGWVSTKYKNTGKVINYHVYFVCHPSYVARAQGTSGGSRAAKEYLGHWKIIADKYRELCLCTKQYTR